MTGNVKDLLRFSSLLLIAAASLELLRASRVEFSSDAIQIHRVLTDFRQRDQLFIESFAPLTYLVAAFEPFSLSITATASRALATAALLACFGSISRYRLLFSSVVSSFFISYACVISRWHMDASALSTSLTVGNALCLVVISSAWHSSPDALWQTLSQIGVADGIIMTSVCLGTSLRDGWFCVTAISFSHISRFFVDIADQKRSISYSVLSFSALQLWRIVIMVTIFIVSFSVAFPSSEIGAGGNYNLRFLSPQVRRALRPQIANYEPAAATMINGQKPPVYGLVPANPLSLYIPQAGFLWSDDFLWDPSIGGFLELRNRERNDSEALIGLDIEHLIQAQKRVLFSDQLNIMSPWFFQQAASEMSNKSDELLTSRLWPGQTVYLRHYESGAFMTAMGKSSIGELYGDIDDEFRRLYVSAKGNATSGSKWQILYTPEKDNGFRIWNRENKCFLATSYRSFPNMHGRRFNDSILHTLKLEVEACCSQFPSRSSSTFYAVDGVMKSLQSQPLLPVSLKFLMQAELSLRSKLMYATAILEAMWKLVLFRRQHAALQDTPNELLVLHDSVHNVGPYKGAFMTVLTCSSLITAVQVLHARRTGAASTTVARHSRRLIPLIWCIFNSLYKIGLQNNEFTVGLGILGLVDLVKELPWRDVVA